MPQKKVETFFKTLETYTHPTVFFESTHRILKTLESIKNLYPNGKLYVGRELTKLHEEMIADTPEVIIQILSEEPVRQKGEFVLLLDLR